MKRGVRLVALLLLLLSSGLSANAVLAVEDVEIEGTVVSVEGTRLTIDADGALLTLDTAEIDARFLQALLVGDQVRVTAFRLPDRSLLVYAIFIQGRPLAPAPVPRDETDAE